MNSDSTWTTLIGTTDQFLAGLVRDQYHFPSFYTLDINGVDVARYGFVSVKISHPARSFFDSTNRMLVRGARHQFRRDLICSSGSALERRFRATDLQISGVHIQMGSRGAEQLRHRRNRSPKTSQSEHHTRAAQALCGSDSGEYHFPESNLEKIRFSGPYYVWVSRFEFHPAIVQSNSICIMRVSSHVAPVEVVE